MLFFKLRQKLVNKRLANWNQEKEVIKYERAFREISRGGRSKISTSKLVLAILIAILAVVMIFAGYATVAMLNVVALTGLGFDFTPLVALISAVAGEVVVTLGYFAKSTKENQIGGITYDMAMNQSLNDENGVG